MKHRLSVRSFAVVLVIVACVVLFVTALPSAPASSAPSAEGQVQRAWQRAQETGAYRFATQLVQTTHPAPKLVNVGRTTRQDTLYIEGQTDLPNRGLWMTLWQDGGSALNPRDGVELRIEGERAYGRTIGGAWQEVEDFSAAFAPDSDPLAYLAGAKNVRALGQETRALPSPDGSPTGGGPLTNGEALTNGEGFANGEGLAYTRYAFAVDGPAFAAHLRDQLERYLIERGQLPAGLRLDSANQYRGMVGDGEVWIDSAGLPLRLAVHLEYPQARGGERVEAEIQTDFSDFAPLAEARRPLERLSAALGLPRAPRDRLRAATVGAFLLLPALLVTQRRSKKAYAALALAIIFSLLIGPLLDGQQVVAFSQWLDAQREAQEASQTAEWLAPQWDPHADPLAAPQDSTALAALDEASVPLLSQIAPAAGESLRLALAPGGNDTAADSDGDGLSDVHEIRLGTLTDDSDSDGDGISDYMEVHGFAMAAGQAPWYHVGDQRWFSDPLNADTNNDGLLDSQECPARVSLDLDGDGQLEPDEHPDPETPCRDTDGDDIPDMFDADNDGDQVPDRVDLSSETVLGEGTAPFTSANPFQLTVNAHQPDYPLLVDLQLRPVNPAHLTYALNVLDWPVDSDGQVQHGKNTTFADSDNPELRSADAAAANGDMRLIPMLEIEMTGDEIPLPLTTQLATRVELGGEISGTVDLAQQGVNVGLDFSFTDGRSYTVNLHQGTCHRLGEALAAWAGVADGATRTLSSRDLVDLADGEHALTAAAGESAACADLDNLVNGPYDDRMVDLHALQPYGISVREKDRTGTLLAYAPLNMVTDESGGGRVAFAARMFYRPGSEDWGDAQQVRVVWLLQMLSDACQPGAENCQTQRTLDQMGVQHTYPEAWRLTGLSVREDHGMDVAILFEAPAGDADPQTDDWLWQASQGLAAAYIGARDCDQVVNEACVGNGVRDIAVAAGYGDSTIRQRLHLTSTATLTERWGIPYSATLHVETRSFEHQDYIAHIMMTDTVKILNDYFSDPASGEPQVQAPTLLFAIDKRARGANLDGEGWNGARLTIDANEDSTAALKWAPYRYTSQAGWEAYPIDEYWDLMDVSYKALLRRLFPADDEDVTQGKMLAARSYYLSLFVGMAGLVQSGQDVLVTPTSGDDTDAILSLIASAGGQAQVFTSVVEKIGTTMKRLSRRTTTFELTQAQFWRELGQALKDGGAWADLRQSGKWGKAGVGLAYGGALTAVSLTIAGIAMDPTSANIAANVTNGLSLLMEIQGAVEAAKDVLDAAREAGGFARAAAKGLSKVAKSIGDEFKSAASIGLVIAIAVTWAVAMVEIFMGSGHAYAIGSAVSEAVAGTIVAVLMFAIAAIPVVGAIVAAVIGVLDALAAAICGALSQEQQGGLAGRWLCGGITGMVTNIFKMMFYSGDVLVDMDDPERFQIGGLDYALATPELGMSVGSRLDYTATVTNTIKYYPPLQGTPGEDANDLLQSSAFAYRWQTQETDFHADQVRGTMRPAWRPVGARFRITETVAMTSALTLNEPGVNRPAGLYLSEAYAVPVQNCVLFGICWITDEKDTNHTYMGRTIKYDVFPATLDGFYTPVQLDLTVDGYSLAWGQAGDVTFPLQKDFDGDGLACKAQNGADPNDRLWDSDGDGLSDRFEDGIGTDNTNFDSDGDGLNDRQELVLETDPLRADSDSDGLPDGEELTGWEFVYAQDSAGVPLRTWVTSDPLDPDGDGDNLTDFQEKTFGFHPGVWSDPQVLTFSSEVREVGAPGLLLRLEEGTGSQLFGDRSGLANNGLCEGEGCPAAGVWGRYGNALLFDGLDDVVRVEHSALGALASGLTVAAWVKPSQLSRRGWIVASAQTASVDGFGFGVDGAGLIFSAFGVHDYVLPAAGIGVDDWVHLAAVLDGDHTVSFYVDGQLRLASGYPQPPNPDQDDALLIGATSAPGGAAPSELFAGRIDELVLFDRALSPAEIERVMAARYNPGDLIVAPGDVLDYRAQVKNELLNRYAQGLLSLDVPQTLSGDGVTPTVFVLQPQQQAVMSGTLQIAGTAPSGVVDLTQVARAQISDWREGSDFAELWLRLDEGPGATTFRDSSGNQPARDGTCVGGGCPAALASALQFDGIDDVVSLPDAGTLGLTASSFTLSAWIKLGDLSGERAVLGGDGFFLGLRAGAPYMRFGGYELDSGVALSAGKWVHLAYRFDQGAAEQAIFVDGERVSDRLGTAAFQGGGALTLGGAAGGGFFRGLIDDVRLFGRALPPDEIRALYGRPALHMPFEEAGSPFADTEFGTQATCSGAACPVTGITGREGYGLRYDGGQALSIAQGGSLDLSDGHFTVGAWIFPSGSDAYPQGILGSESGPGNSYPALYRAGRRVGFGFSSGTALTTTETAQDVLTLDDWNHVALTCSGDELVLYVNGLRVGSRLGPDANWCARHSSAFYLGRATDTGSVYIRNLYVHDEGDGAGNAELVINWGNQVILNRGSVDEHTNLPVEQTFEFVQSAYLRVWENDGGRGDVYDDGDDNLVYRSFSTNHPEDSAITGWYGSGGATEVTLHHQYTNPSVPFQGRIDELVIYKRALSAADVDALYRSAFAAMRLRFDDPPGSTRFDNAVDPSGANDGLCAGAACPMAGASGRDNQAVRFDGVDDAVSTAMRIDPSDAGEGVTLLAWVYPESTSAGNHQVISSDDGGYDWSLLRQGAAWCVFNGAAPHCFLGATVAVGQWQHVAAVFDPASDRVTLYRNGVTASDAPLPGGLGASDQPIAIGHNPGSGDERFDGRIDDVQVVARALAGWEVARHYRAAPQLQLHMDEPVGATRFVDSSGNGNHGLSASDTTSPTAGLTGQIGLALAFDGVDDVLTVPDAPALDLTSFTVGAWVNPYGDGTITQTLLAKGYNYHLLIGPAQDRVGFGYVGGGDCIFSYDDVSAGSFIPGAWNHVLLTFDGSDLQLYLNGSLDRSVRTGGAPCLNNEPLQIGNGVPGTAPLRGRVDELTLYDHALSPFEVRDIFLYQGKGIEERQRHAITVDAEPPSSILRSDEPYRADREVVLQVEARDSGSGVVLEELGVQRPGQGDTTWSAAPRCLDAPGDTAWCPHFVPAGEGLYRLQLRGTDRVGNRETPAQTYAIYVDATPPDVGIDLPANSLVGAQFHPTLKYTWAAPLSGPVSDPGIPGGQTGSGVGAVWVTLLTDGGELAGAGAQRATVAAGSWSLAYALGAADPSGTYTVTVQAEDNVGNSTRLVAPVQVMRLEADPARPPATAALEVASAPYLPVFAVRGSEGAATDRAETAAPVRVAPTAGVTDSFYLDARAPAAHLDLGSLPTSGVSDTLPFRGTASDRVVPVGVSWETDDGAAEAGLEIGCADMTWHAAAPGTLSDQRGYLWEGRLQRGADCWVRLSDSAGDGGMSGSVQVCGSPVANWTSTDYTNALEFPFTATAPDCEPDLPVAGLDKVEVAFRPTTPGAPFYNELPPEGQVLHLPLDDGPGGSGLLRFQDLSGLGHTGDCAGDECPIPGGTGHTGRAARFDGVDDHLQIDHDLNRLPLTVGMWFYMTREAAAYADGPEGVYLFSNDDPGHWGFGLSISQSENKLVVQKHNGWDYSDVVVPLNEWHHVAIVTDASGLYHLYWDGSERFSGTTALEQDGKAYFWIGGNPADPAARRYLTGLIDDVRVLDRALSAAQVRDLYLGAGPVLALPLDAPFKAHGDRLVDASGWGHDGVLECGSDDPAIKTVPGRVGAYALAFDGADDVVTVPDRPALDLDRLSVGAWVRPQGFGAEQPLIVKSNQTGAPVNYGIYLTADGHARFVIYKADCITFRSMESAGSLALDAWTHVMLTFDGERFTGYVNGQPADSFSFSAAGLCPDDGALVSGPLAGALDDVRVYPRALQQAEIVALVQSAWHTATLSSQGADSATWNAQVPAGLEGVYRLDVRAWDKAGHPDNSAQSQDAWRGLVDTTAPRVRLTRQMLDGTTDRYTAEAWDFNLAEEAFLSPCGETAGAAREFYQSPWYLTAPGGTFTEAQRLHQLSARCTIPAEHELAQVGATDTPGEANAVVVSGTFAYVADGSSGLRVLNVADPSNPFEVGAYTATLYIEDVAIAGDAVYLATSEQGLVVLDVSDPADPRQIGWHEPPYPDCKTVAVAGSYAYLACWYWPGTIVQMFDVSDPANPSELDRYELFSPDYPPIYDMDTAGDYVYLAGTGGLYVVRFWHDGSSWQHDTGSYTQTLDARSVAVYGNTAYVGDWDDAGRLDSSLHFFDITSPTNPSHIGAYRTPGIVLGVAIAGVHTQTHAYLASGNHGLRVWDTSSVSNPGPVGFAGTPRSARDVTVVGDRVYVAAGPAGLLVLEAFVRGEQKQMTACDAYGHCTTTQEQVGASGPGVFIHAMPPIYTDDSDVFEISTEVHALLPPAQLRSLAELPENASLERLAQLEALHSMRALTVTMDSVPIYTETWSPDTLLGVVRRAADRVTLDASFDPGTDSVGYETPVDTLAVQPDGKVLVGGNFTTLGGGPRANVGRLNPDGTLDASFNPGANDSVRTLVVQPDGRILVGGDFVTLDGQPRSCIGRLNPDGTLDTTFNPPQANYGAEVHTLALQPDGRILVGGTFSSLGGQPRANIARLEPDGTLDAGFNPGVENIGRVTVQALAVQPDGKILVGGDFNTLGGQPRNLFGRLNPNGTLDTDFDAGLRGAWVEALALQPDGKILIGGAFYGPVFGKNSYIVRLNPDGTHDPSFNLGASYYVGALTLQPDGKILVGGSFNALAEQPCSYIGRLNPDGTLDPSFNLGAGGTVYALALGTDGKLLVGGSFSALGGYPRDHIGRINLGGDSPPSDGPHVIRAIVENYNNETYSDTLTVTVDTQPPTITVAPGPISGSAYRPDGGIELTGQVTDTAGVAAVQLSVDAAAGAVTALEATVTAGTWRAAWPVDAWHLPDGETVTVTAQATDVGGHTASSIRSMSVDVAPPAPVTLTLRTAAGTLRPGATVRAVSLPLTLTWSASSDGSGLASYLTQWTVSAGDGVSDVLRTHAPASRADVLAVPEPARVVVQLAAEDVHGNARWQSFGPVYVDSPFTPDYVSLEAGETGPSRPYADWMQTGCSLVGVDRRANLTAPGGAALASEQKFYATWDAGGVRLAWTGANWSNDGDLFIYLDTAAGGSVAAYNPYSPTMTDTLIYLPGVTPDSSAAGMAADYLVWVQDSETAQLWRWDGTAWVLATDLGPDVYRFDPGLRQGQTDLYLPFSQLGIGDPAATTLDLLALASEDEGSASGAGQGLRLWAAMPPANPVNSARVVETSHYAEAGPTFALLQRYHWQGLGPGVCPNGAIPAPAKAGDARPLATSQAGAFHDADLELSLSVEPAGLVYHYLGDGLFWMWENLFGGRSGDASTLFTFADAEHPPLGDGAQIAFTLRYNNRGTAPASGVQLDLSTRYALRLPGGTHLPGEQRDHQVIHLGTLAPGAEGSLTFSGVVDVQRAFNAYYVPCLATAPEPVCAAYLRVAALEAAVYDAAHPSPGPALEWMWADFGVDHQPPAFYDIQSPELFVSTRTHTVRGYAFDAAGVTTVTLAVNTPSAGTHTITCPDATPADGRWSCPWDVTASNGGVAPQEGAVFEVQLGVVDGTGQAVAHSGWRPFIVDATPPTVTLDPQASDVVTSGVLLRERTFTLAGAVADNRALGRVEVCVDGDCGPADVALDPAAVAVTYEDVPAAPLAIGASTACGGDELTRSWSVTESFAIDTVSVGFSAQHSHRDDLWVELASPSGTRVKLLFTDGITETRFSHFDALLHDAATDVHSARQDDDPGAPYHDRAARPHEPLRIFRGENAAGTWTLSICDTRPAQDDGLYQRARLNIKPSDTSARAGRWSDTVHNLDEMDGVQKNIAIYGVDKVGNRSTEPLQLEVTIDNVPPQVTVLSRLDRLSLGTQEVVLAGLSTDGGGLGDVSVYVQTPGGAFDTRPTAPTEFYRVYLPPILSGVFSAARGWEQLVSGLTPSSDRSLEVAGAPQVRAWEYTLEPNQVGVYRLWVTAVDVAGNSTTVGPFEVVVDPQEAQRVYLPAVLAGFEQLPDLLLGDGEITATGAELEIVNVGTGSVTRGFRVDVYFNPAPIPTDPYQVWQDLAPYGGHWLVDGAALPLDPGEQITLTLNDVYYQAAASRYPPSWQEVQTLYVQVDTLDEVMETHEAVGGDYENISGEVISRLLDEDDTNDH